MMFNRIFLMVCILSSGIIASSVQGVVKITPHTPIKRTITGDIIHYAQYTVEGNLIASFNKQTNVYIGAFVTEYGAVHYSPAEALILFNLFAECQKSYPSSATLDFH